jgi:hypothetical protein
MGEETLISGKISDIEALDLQRFYSRPEQDMASIK